MGQLLVLDLVQSRTLPVLSDGMALIKTGIAFPSMKVCKTQTGNNENWVTLLKLRYFAQSCFPWYDYILGLM